MITTNCHLGWFFFVKTFFSSNEKGYGLSGSRKTLPFPAFGACHCGETSTWIGGLCGPGDQCKSGFIFLVATNLHLSRSTRCPGPRGGLPMMFILFWWMWWWVFGCCLDVVVVDDDDDDDDDDEWWRKGRWPKNTKEGRMRQILFSWKVVLHWKMFCELRGMADVVMIEPGQGGSIVTLGLESLPWVNHRDNHLGGGFKDFLFSPLLWQASHFD